MSVDLGNNRARGVANDLTELVGHTPVVRLNRLAASSHGSVVVKLENLNPGGSVKDRIGLAMVEAAERDGLIGPGSVLVEAKSGNTGIALAWVGAVKGYRVILTMPDTMSIERRRLLQAYGAELVLTPGTEGMSAAVSHARRIADETPEALLVSQFTNPANPDAHYRTTAAEILEQTGGRVDVFVAGVGTGGSVTGVGRLLKEHDSRIRVVAVEPEASPVLSGGAAGPHRIQGIGPGFVPDVLDRSVIDEVVTVSADDATRVARELAAREGILGGISAGANVAAALEVAARESSAGKTILTLICDTGERYLSTWLYEE